MSRSHYCDTVDGRVPYPMDRCPWKDHDAEQEDGGK